MKPPSTNPNLQGVEAPLLVWGERRTEPDWDRFVAALVALAMREVEEPPAKEDCE